MSTAVVKFKTMENTNSNNAKDFLVRTESCISSVSADSKDSSYDTRTLIGDHTINVVVNGDAHNDVSDSKETSDSEPKRKPVTRKQKLTFAGIAFVGLGDVLLFSLLAPFFPNEAQKKGMSTSLSGLVFGVFALVSFVSSPIFGKYVTQIGPRFMFFSGTFVAAGCGIIFGVLDEIEDDNIFTIYCFVVRSLEALGSSASMTASMTIIATIFPDNIAQMTGLLEMFCGLGLMIGPAIGGLLYKIGGYKLPFLVMGAVDLVVLVLIMFILPDQTVKGDDAKPGSLLKFMMIPVMWPMSLALVVASATLGFLDPTLTLHLQTFGVSIPVAGVLFLLLGGVYSMTMPIWGYLADKQGRTRLMMLIGFYLLGVSYMLIGPSPLLNLPNYLWIVIVSLGLTGLSIGCACMPIYLDMMVSARWYGFPNDMATNGLVSGVFTGCFSLGTFVGPVLGGILKDHIGFSWTSTYFAAANFAVILIMGAFCIWEYQWGKGRRKPSKCFGVSVQHEDGSRTDTGPLIAEA